MTMRLLKASPEGEFSLHTFTDRDIPRYAILSHTWIRGQDKEVIYEDITHNTGSQKEGYNKLTFCWHQARLHDLEYFWIDTCCINKSSDRELTEAINSMFRWYQRAERCYVYLADVPARLNAATSRQGDWESAFRNSRWFTRSWTLQELIAPRKVEFYSCDHVLLGDKVSLEANIYEATRIDIEALRGRELSKFSIETRLSWSKGREATREEDRAYSLLGICNVYLPLIYSETYDNAIRRLRKEAAESTGGSVREDPSRNTASGFKAHAPSTPHHALERRFPFSTIPLPRDPEFVDRPDLFEQIHSRLSEPASRVALAGLGGMGKSQLAIEYVYRERERSPSTWIFWIYGSTVATFEESCQMIAERLGLATTDRQRTSSLELFSQWLMDERNGSWLMLVDNADDTNVYFEPITDAAEAAVSASPVAGNISRFLSRSLHGRVLFTSRNDDLASRLVGGYRNVIKITPMHVPEGVVLFRKKRALQSSEQDDEQDLLELLRVIESIPLAITQAAAFINRGKHCGSVKSYLQLYNQNEKSRQSLLRFDGGDLRRDNKASNSILLTWQLSFEQIRRERSTAADLLSLMSFFHRQGIPESALRDATRDWLRPSEQDGAFEFQEDLTHLLNYNLITSLPEDDAYEMHRLVQISTQLWLNSKGRAQHWQGAFLKTMARIMPSGEFETWKSCQVLFAHAEAAAAQFPENESMQEDWFCIVSRATAYAEDTGQYRAAEQMGRTGLTAAERKLGNQNLVTLDYYNNVGRVLRYQGKYEEAEVLCRRALEARERVLGHEHPNTLSSLNNLANILTDQAKYKKAEVLHRRALEVRETVLGYEHPNTLSSLNNLANTLADQAKYEEAEVLYRQVLDQRERFLGREHLRTIESVESLAYVQVRQERFTSSLPRYSRAVSGYTAVLGSDHPRTRSCATSHQYVLSKVNERV